MRPLLLISLFAAGCGSSADDWFCGDLGCAWTDLEWGRIASLGNPGPPPPDLSNRVWNDAAAARLGRAFYFDSGFSGVVTELDAIRRPSPPARAAKGAPANVSCATCHDLGHGGFDVTPSPRHVSVGAGWTDVNALSTVNAAYRQVVFWNGRADSLWALNAIVAESPTTMNGNRLALAHRIFDVHRADYEAVFGPLDPAIGSNPARFPPAGKPNAPGGVWEAMSREDQDVVTGVLVNWAKAIAAYEHLMVSVDSDFDRFVREGVASNAISAAAKRGARLFVGKAGCIDCHSGPHLTDELFHNIGVPQTGLAVPTTKDCPRSDDPTAPCDCEDGPRCAPWGAYDGLQRLASDELFKFRRDSPWSDDPYDGSRGTYLMSEVDPRLKGAWRTPSLRNVARGAPYMHNGAFATLEEVLWHYDGGGQGGSGDRVGSPAPQMKPLLLSLREITDLVAFLETLTGSNPAPLQP